MSWPLGKVLDIGEVISGFAFKSEWFGVGNAKVIRIGDLQDGRVDLVGAETFDESDHQVREQFKIRNGDILMALSGATVGKIAVADTAIEGSYLNQRVAVVRGKCPTNTEYLKYVFSGSLLQKLLTNAGGAAQPNLSPKDLGDMQIPLPPLEEQKRIAAILDKADAIRRKRQQAIKLADDFLHSVFLEMFGDPVTNPKGWEVDLLKNQILSANNGLSRRSAAEENFGDIVLRLQDVHYDGIRYNKKLSRIQLDESEKRRYLLHEGDLLFIRVNGNPDYVGRSAVFSRYDEHIYHNDHLIRLKVGKNYNSEFLSFAFNSKGGRKLISKYIKTSAGQHTISQDGIERIAFYIPPIHLQNKFVSIKNKVLSIPYDVEFSENLFASLSQKAFSGMI